MKRARFLFGAAAAAVIWWGAIYAITQNASILTGLYWALETATTVGYGDITPQGNGGHLLASACMLTAIPLLAAAFGQLHLDKVRKHVDDRLSEHHDAIHERLDRIEQHDRGRGG